MARWTREREAIPFKLSSPFTPSGDQPQAIAKLDAQLRAGAPFQTLLGVTGSGKTYTVGNVIASQNRPTLVIAPNKTLAAQLYAEYRDLFPENRVRYFVSYYDYYQPEAYVPATDTFIEKDSAINEEIDKMRHSATKALLETTDVIIVASVSCIYGLGAPEEYFKMMLFAEEKERISRDEVIRKLVSMQYRRTDIEFQRGTFRVRGETIDIFPSDQNSRAVRVLFFGDEIERISEIDSITGAVTKRLGICAIYPVSHFVTSKESVLRAMKTIRTELTARLRELESIGKLFEAQRLEQRTLYDLELLAEIGFCPGIENYSRHLTGRGVGEPPATLIDYFPENYLLVIDESHVTASQISAMARGDRSRKQTLVDYGFRLPSALDNRPLTGEEFWKRAGQCIFVSATPGDWELEKSKPHVVELINRPTGLLDPEIVVKPARNQVDDLLEEIRRTVERGERVLALTLTKRMAEDLADYLRDIKVRAKYLHSDIQTIERIELLRGLRRGDFDVLIGINLLREGIDLVEVSLVAILDADKEGFLRSTRSLIQIMGRAARNIHGRVILYADHVTHSMKQAIAETDRRRAIQRAFNEAHGVVPRSATKAMGAGLLPEDAGESLSLEKLGLSISVPKDPKEQQRLVERLKKDMFEAAARREFERAASLRDAINAISAELLAASGNAQVEGDEL